MHDIYILQSEMDKSYYVGEAPKAEVRLIFHNQGKQRYTKARIPWVIVYKEKLFDRHEALLREKEIKKKKVKNILNG